MNKGNPAYQRIFAERCICPEPFLLTVVHTTGDVSVCCTGRLQEEYKYVGNIFQQSLREIWNGEKLRRFRALVYAGEYHKACKPFCPQLVALRKGEVPPWYSYLCDAEVHAHVARGDTTLSTPFRAVSIATDSSCNLVCRMCRVDPAFHATAVERQATRRTFEQVLLDIDRIRHIELLGSGEVFVIKAAMEFLDDLAKRDVGHLTLRLVTNALPITEKKWERVRRVKAREKRVNVSIDAARAGTYESIRVGGRWEQLCERMEFLAGERAKGEIDHLQLSYVVMRRNLDEMVPFIELAKRWRCDRIEFQRAFGVFWGLDNFFESGEPAALAKLARVLEHPAFRDDSLSIDVSSFDAYRGYRQTLGGWRGFAPRAAAMVAEQLTIKLAAELRRRSPLAFRLARTAFYRGRGKPVPEEPERSPEPHV
jgi:MoaA/NifB/PqqE/SkfB family radical SAM enzyme